MSKETVGKMKVVVPSNNVQSFLRALNSRRFDVEVDDITVKKLHAGLSEIVSQIKTSTYLFIPVSNPGKGKYSLDALAKRYGVINRRMYSRHQDNTRFEYVKYSVLDDVLLLTKMMNISLYPETVLRSYMF